MEYLNKIFYFVSNFSIPADIIISWAGGGPREPFPDQVYSFYYELRTMNYELLHEGAKMQNKPNSTFLYPCILVSLSSCIHVFYQTNPILPFPLYFFLFPFAFLLSYETNPI